MRRRIRIEDAVGETRAAVYEDGQLVELHIRRVSDAGRPRAGDVFTGRVTSIEPRLGAAFVDLGQTPDQMPGENRAGFLRFTTSPNMPRLAEGVLADVIVTREAEPGKGPIVGWTAAASRDAPGPVSQQDLRTALTARFSHADIVDGQVATALDVVETEIAIPGGGTITIEPTKALVAIDVDKGYAVSGLAVGEAAAPVIARQLRLRGLGGLICIDFPNLRQPKQREALLKAVSRSFETDPDNPKMSTLSRFGVIEMTRTRPDRSIDQLVRENPAESLAMDALRRLAREAKSSPGAQLTLHVPDPAFTWLDADTIGWRTRMAERIGARFALDKGDDLSVSSDR